MSRDPALDAAVAARLADRFRELRAATGLTQEQVAHAAGIHRNHYQLLESGLSDRAKGTTANPRLSTLIALCGVYDIEVADLVADAVVSPDKQTARAAVDLSVRGNGPGLTSSRAPRG